MTIQRRVGLVFAALVVGIGGATTVAFALPALRARDPRPVPTREQLEAYEEALTPHAKHGGFVVEEGLKFGLGQIERGEGGPVIFQAVGWVDELNGVRKEFNNQGHLVKGTQLEPAIADFDAAFKLYIDAAQTIGAAAVASGDPQKRLLDRAAETGHAADLRYDKASALLQKLRQERGLPMTARFPSPKE
jgi:hypothetical protein